MPQLPRLLPVPSFWHELTIKASASGIMFLKESAFRSRYIGSATARVDCQGNFYSKVSDYKKVQDAELERAGFNKRKSPHNTATALKGAKNSEQDKITEVPADPQRKKRKGGYTINKPELRNRLLTFIRTSKGKKELYFWTITFPKQITDELAYQAFNTWLTALRQKKMLHNYIWVAERQDGKRITEEGKQPTNSIHFHIAIPHRMSVVAANRLMRVTLSTFCKKGLLGDYSNAQCKRYQGVDIAKNRKTNRVVNFAIKKGSRSLTTYLTKYVAKNDSTFDHLAWHNSRGFSALFTGITFTPDEFYKLQFNLFVFPKRVVDNKYIVFMPWRDGLPPPLLEDHLTQLNDYCQEVVI